MEDIQTLHPEDTTRTTLQKYKKHKSHSNELFSSLFSDIKQHLKDDFHSHPNHKVDPISNSMTGDTIEVKQTIERSPFHLQYATSRSSSSFSKSLHKKIVSSIYSDTEDKIDAYQSLSKRLDTRARIRIAQLERHKQWFLYDVQKIMERRQTDYLLHKRIILQKKQNAVRRTQGLLFELLGGCEKQLFERQRRQELKRQSLKRRKIELIDDLMWRLFASRMKFDLCLLMANDLDEEKLIDFDVQDINPSKHEQLYNFLTSLLSKKISGSGNHNVVLNRITRIGPKDTHASTIHERIDDGLLESSLSLTKILSTVVKNYNFEDETKSLSNQTHQLSQTVKQTKAKPRLPLYTLITNCPIKPMLLNGRGFSQNVSQEIRVQNTKLIELCGNRIYFCLEEQFALNKIDDDYDDVFNNKIPTSMEGTGKSLHEYVLQCLYALYLPPSTAKNLNITMVQTSLVLDLKVSSLEAKHRQEQSTFTLEENRYREFIQCFPDILKVRVGKEDLHFVPASVTQLGKGMSSYEYSKTGVNSSHPKLFVPTRSVKTENGCRGNNNRPMVGAVLRPLSCTSTKILFEAYANYVSSNEYKGPEILPSLFCIPIKDSIHLPNKQNVCDCCNVSQPEFEFAKVPCKRKGSYEVLIIQYHTVTGTLDRTRNFEDSSNIWHDFSLCRWTSCMMKSMKMSSHCLCKEHEKILKITTTRNEEEQLSARQICTLNQPNQQMNAINNPEMLDTKLIKTSENLLNELKSGALMSSVKGFWSSKLPFQYMKINNVVHFLMSILGNTEKIFFYFLQVLLMRSATRIYFQRG